MQTANQEKAKMHRQGFTLLELTVVVAIIVLVSSLVYANYHSINNQGDAIAFNERIVNDIRKAENNSLKRKSWLGQVPDGWGVKLDNTNDRYTIFADFDGDKVLSTPVKLLIHGTEWTSGSTFAESSSAAKTVTKYGNAAQVASGGRPSNTNGYWSFDGTGDYLSLADSADWNFGSGDFTIDGWIKPVALGAYQVIAWQGDGTLASLISFRFRLQNDNKLLGGIYSGSTDYSITSSGTIDSNWHHVAMIRNGSNLMLFIDGVMNGTLSTLSTNAANDAATTLLAGCLYIAPSTYSSCLNGYIDDLRIVKGAAMWTHNFTVPDRAHTADVETVKVENLGKGIKIASLVGNGGAVDPLSVYFSPLDYSSYQNGSVSLANIVVGINDAGGTTAKTITINPYGLVSSE
jgi:prepilin-type N-terminal cleavage/methylation domain-containing protein